MVNCVTGQNPLLCEHWRVAEICENRAIFLSLLPGAILAIVKKNLLNFSSVSTPEELYVAIPHSFYVLDIFFYSEIIKFV